ncbi:hypothetical protein [Singulisphaera sp. PoT]|uniref:hypothetical protein n=1 Tax=Singulisphaera sp. PoT TaxID=3411797 RepID=UPI003BF4891F
MLRLLNRHGDDALRLLSRPSGLAMVSRHGDDAAAVLIRHRAVAEPVLEALGEPAIGALGALGPRGGRRLAMMAGELAGGGRAPELLAVIARRGDRAMDFAWEHRGVLAGGVALAAFLSDPEPYLDGTARLAGAGGEAVARIAGAVAEEAVKPVAKAAGGVAAEARTHLARALLVAGLILALAAVLLVRSGLLGWLPVRVGIKVAGKHIVAAMGKGR